MTTLIDLYTKSTDGIQLAIRNALGVDASDAFLLNTKNFDITDVRTGIKLIRNGLTHLPYATIYKSHLDRLQMLYGLVRSTDYPDINMVTLKRAIVAELPHNLYLMSSLPDKLRLKRLHRLYKTNKLNAAAWILLTQPDLSDIKLQDTEIPNIQFTDKNIEIFGIEFMSRVLTHYPNSLKDIIRHPILEEILFTNKYLSEAQIDSYLGRMFLQYKQWHYDELIAMCIRQNDHDRLIEIFERVYRASCANTDLYKKLGCYKTYRLVATVIGCLESNTLPKRKHSILGQNLLATIQLYNYEIKALRPFIIERGVELLSN